MKSAVKSAVIFYSLEGNTRYIADGISKAIKADLIEIKATKPLQKNFTKFIFGGYMAVFKKKPDILPIEQSLEDYDLIVIGTPVWAGSFSPYVLSFLSKYTITNKKVALFSCCGGGTGKAIVSLKEALSGNEIVNTAEFKEPIFGKLEVLKDSINWAKRLNI